MLHSVLGLVGEGEQVGDVLQARSASYEASLVSVEWFVQLNVFDELALEEDLVQLGQGRQDSDHTDISFRRVLGVRLRKHD